MFKFLFLVACVTYSVGYSNAESRKIVKLPPEVARDILQAIAICVTDVKLNARALDSIKDGKYSEDQSFKNFVHCSFQKSGYLEKDGQLNIDKATAIFHNEPTVKAAIEKCSKVDVEDKVEFSSKFLKCYSDISPVDVTV